MSPVGRGRPAVVLLVAAGLAAPVGSPALAQQSGFGGVLACTDDPAAVVYSVDTDGDGAYGVVARGLESGCTATLLPEDGDHSYEDADVSDDGRRLAVSTDEGGVGQGIAVTDGAALRRITFPPVSDSAVSFDVEPAWSPDGSRLLFSRVTVRRNGTFESSVLQVAAAGGEPARVPGGGFGRAPDWHPDGRLITFAYRDSTQDLVYVQTLDAAERRAVADGTDPVWAPDGRRIAYVSVVEEDPDLDRDAHRTSLSVVDVPTFERTRLQATSHGMTAVSSPAWTRDGQSLTYTRADYDDQRDLGQGDLWAVDAYGERASALATTPQDEIQPGAVGPRPADVVAGAPSTYVPITPRRLLDTRTTHGDGRVGQQRSVRVRVRGVQTSEGRVPEDATAAVLNVTALNPTVSTDVRAYPSGSAVPTASNLNLQHGQTVPNLVTVQLGADGAVELRNNSGAVHLVADLAGWYAPGDSGAGYAPVQPRRILDTRTQSGPHPGPVGAGQTVDLQVTGELRSGDGRTVTVPANATAVVLNVTGTRPTAATDIRVYPTPSARAPVPVVSNLNLARGQTAANAVIAAVGDGGRVRLRNQAGSTHLIADIAGYYAPDAPGRFVPVPPVRFLDTRAAIGASPFPLRPPSSLTTQVAGRRAVPASATAVIVNLTATAVTESTDLRLYPATTNGEVPTVSTLNVVRGATRANLAVVQVGETGLIRARSSRGSAHLIADLAGYFVP